MRPRRNTITSPAMATFRCAASCYDRTPVLCAVACPNNRRLGEPGALECDNTPAAPDEEPDELLEISFADAPPPEKKL